ncbi:hypothetical protein [Neotabrizicola sp. sgz301269]|uniref:hypothetical protein n=1 Tax=Neotabrizicola sp. sgz301269 TaxID=3276282 RepID=UPI00377056BE
MTATAGLAGWRALRPEDVPAPRAALDEAAFRAVYADPPAIVRPTRVYHLGHSLVGPDMPVMLAAALGHGFDSQIGWGTSLRDHWQGEVKGLEATRLADEALAGGGYDAVILTEMVELKDAIRWHASANHLAKWVARARTGNPQARVLLYETWHRLDDPAGWLDRIADDRAALWEAALLRPALAEAGGVIHVIPGGPVLAAAVRAAEAGALPGIPDRRAFFTDEIHPSDLGAWLIAMTHAAVLSGQSPEGLPARLPKRDGTLAGAPSDAVAVALQRLVWIEVAGYPPTGIRAG